MVTETTTIGVVTLDTIGEITDASISIDVMITTTTIATDGVTIGATTETIGAVIVTTAIIIDEHLGRDNDRDHARR